MNTRTRMSVCAMVLFLVVWGITPTILEAQSRGAADPDAAESSDAESSDVVVSPRNLPDGAEPEHLVAGALGSNSNAVDAWSIHCPSGTHHLHFDLCDFSSGGPHLGILCHDFETGFSTYRRASAGGCTAFTARGGGSGIYVCYVFKTGGCTGCSGGYDSIQVCHNSGHGVINHTAHFLFQNQ